jgi:hypothetical protein
MVKNKLIISKKSVSENKNFFFSSSFSIFEYHLMTPDSNPKKNTANKICHKVSILEMTPYSATENPAF